jgi:sulfonate transport system permease protein
VSSQVSAPKAGAPPAPVEYGRSLRTSYKTWRVALAAVGTLVAWQVIAMIIAGGSAHPEQILPTPIETIRGFNGLSDYWTGGFGVAAPQEGGGQTFLAALLALVENAFITGTRLVLGLGLSLIFGVGSGLLIGYVKSLRRFAFGPLNFLGVLPLLATVPLFAFWFGPTTRAAVLFILFGAGIIILRSTLNAVENVPAVYVEAAATMGAGRFRMYRTVIIPAILPELRAGVQIALTFSWSLALGAELIGLQSGIGRMMILAMRFSQVDRMILIGLVFVVLAAGSVLIFDRLASKALAWAD